MSNFKNALFDWTEFGLKVIVIIGGIVTFFQYFEAKEKDKVKQTMEHVQVFSSSSLLESRLTLNEIWLPYQTIFYQISQQTVASEEDKMKIRGKIVLPVIEQNNVFKELILLVDFFTNVQICVQHEICDRQVAEAFFGDYARSFYRLHQPWIRVQRQAIPSFACHLEAFVYPQRQGC